MPVEISKVDKLRKTISNWMAILKYLDITNEVSSPRSRGESFKGLRVLRRIVTGSKQ